MNPTLTRVSGLTVGHADDTDAATGCTAVLGPFRAAVEIFGLATGSRELDALSPLHLVPRCDALLLTGGSAFGLSAADGVVAWLEERGRGYETPAARVPIVPAAVIYDLGIGRADVRPGPAMGRAAAEAAAGTPVVEGRVGAGCGASVGKLHGPTRAQRGGLGTFAETRDRTTVGALAVVNAFGDVLDARGEVLAGCLDERGGFLDTAAALREGRVGGSPDSARPAESTTLAVVATDVALGKRSLQVVARQAAVAVARRIRPSGTPFDGDIIFALSTGEDEPSKRARRDAEVEPLALLGLALRAQAALERAIERAVTAASAEPA